MSQGFSDDLPSSELPSVRRSMSSIVAGLLSAAFALLVQAPGCSNGDSCIPRPGSCDLAAPSLSLFDVTKNCLGSPVLLTGVCNTSLDRCFASAGEGLACAVAPDGRVYVGLSSDNDIFTAAGWHFQEPTSPRSDGVPADEMLTEPLVSQCRQASIAPPCSGVILPDRDGNPIADTGTGAADPAEAGDDM
jgi:hypothetical protein